MSIEQLDSVLESSVREAFPPEVEFILSAMEAGPVPVVERQQVQRIRHRVRARLQLHSDLEGVVPRTLYVKNVSTKAMGFVSERPLPLSHGGMVEVPGFDGRPVRVACTVLRCREAAPGWFEGAVYFNRPQESFSADSLEVWE